MGELRCRFGGGRSFVSEPERRRFLFIGLGVSIRLVGKSVRLMGVSGLGAVDLGA